MERVPTTFYLFWNFQTLTHANNQWDEESKQRKQIEIFLEHAKYVRNIIFNPIYFNINKVELG